MGKLAEPDFRPQPSILSIALSNNLPLKPPCSDVPRGTLPSCLPFIETELEIPSQHMQPQKLVNHCSLLRKNQ